MRKIYNCYIDNFEGDGKFEEEWKRINQSFDKYLKENQILKNDFEFYHKEDLDQNGFNEIFNAEKKVSAFFFCGHYDKGNGIKLNRIIINEEFTIHKFLEQPQLRFVSLNMCNNKQFCDTLIKKAKEKSHPLVILGTNAAINGGKAESFMNQFINELLEFKKSLKDALETSLSTDKEGNRKWEFFSTDEDLTNLNFFDLLTYSFKEGDRNFYSLFSTDFVGNEFSKAFTSNEIKINPMPFMTNLNFTQKYLPYAYGALLNGAFDVYESIKHYEGKIAKLKEDNLPFFVINKANGDRYKYEQLSDCIVSEITFPKGGSNPVEIIKDEILNKVWFETQRLRDLINTKSGIEQQTEKLSKAQNTLIQINGSVFNYNFFVNQFIAIKKRTSITTKYRLTMDGITTSKDLIVQLLEVMVDLKTQTLSKIIHEREEKDALNVLNEQLNHKFKQNTIIICFQYKEDGFKEETNKMLYRFVENLEQLGEKEYNFLLIILNHAPSLHHASFGEEEPINFVIKKIREIGEIKHLKGVRDLKYITPHEIGKSYYDVWKKLTEVLSAGNNEQLVSIQKDLFLIPE